MSDKSKQPTDVAQTAGFLGNLVNQVRLVWRLFNDRRVSGWVKLIPIAGLAYLLSPIDLLPDLLIPGLGELDDLTIILVSLKMFVDLAPPEIVREHLNNLTRRAVKRQSSSEPYIDVPYRVVDDDKSNKESR
ncbi:MAG: DUF1232 domain-containing protein [Anaerolineae bacterium]|nr:DUF1232 domain-containing protein [Anaerolineae bacterium]